MTSTPPAETARPAGVTVGVGLVALLVAAAATGVAAPLLVEDPGPFVRWGLPIARFLQVIAGVTTFGMLGAAAFLVPDTTHTDRRGEAMRFAAFTAMVWALVSGLLLVMSFADLAGLPLTSAGFLQQLTTFVWQLELTRIQLIVTLCAAGVALGAAFTTRRAPMAWLTLVALFAVILPALTGHAAGSASHEDAVNALGIHLIGVATWVGGLTALVVLRPGLGRDLGAVVGRFSVLATWAYAAVALSGIQQAIIRVGSWSGLTTAYGVIVLVKATILVALGVLGWRQRALLTGRLRADHTDGRAFARLGLTELALMGVATGLSAVLARSIPPVPDALPNPSRVLELTGFPDPGPMQPLGWLTQWRISWLFLSIALIMVGLYLAGVVRLRRRGDHWPVWRTVCWVAGWLVFVYATSGVLDIYGRVLFSAHMAMHMVVAMLVPLLLVPASSITLALRALPARRDKTWGPRELLTHVSHSRAMRFLANPVVAAFLFFVSMAIFYYSPAFELALRTHTGHLLMMGHFMLTGFLFTWVLIGTDPGPPKWSPLALLGVLFVTISFHAFFGVILTGSDELLAPGFFTALDLPWGPDPLADQHTAGEVAWGVGEVPTLILSVIVALNWVRSDARETQRKDRQADRDHDAELTAYNAYLASLREHDGDHDHDAARGTQETR